MDGYRSALSSGVNQYYSPTAGDLSCTLHKRDSSAQNALGCPHLLKTSPVAASSHQVTWITGLGHTCASHSCLHLPAGRRKRRKKGRERGREREAGKEGDCIWQLPPAARVRAVDSHSGRGRLTMSSATSTTSLPSGLSVLTTFPDVLFIPEIVSVGFSLGEGRCCLWDIQTPHVTGV